MGMCGLGAGGGGATQTATNMRVNELLEVQRQQMKDEVTLLFLGPGESGKSTIFKQLRFIYGNGFSQHEMEFYVGEIRINIMSQMKVLLDAAVNLGLELETKNRKKGKDIQELASSLTIDNWNKEIAQDIKTLWEDKYIQETYNQRSSFQLNDSCKYFMDNIDRVVKDDFLPLPEDILRSRVKSVGAVEEKFQIDNLTFRVIDVGGQRAERRKWLPCFADVTSVLFIVGISEYDQRLREDSQQNRLIESIFLFEQVCNSSFFRTTNFILFFNKVDLLQEKLQKVDLSVLFPSYEGGSDIEKAKTFLVNRFIEKNHSPHDVYYHFTCAIDTDSFGKIFNDVKDTVVNRIMLEIKQDSSHSVLHTLHFLACT